MGKKIGTIILTIYVTIVTVACAVFGTLYFLGRNGIDPIKELTYSEAKVLVNKVYDKLLGKGGISASTSGISEAKISSLNYTDFEGEEIPEFIYQTFLAYNAQSLKTMNDYFNNGVKTDVWYKDENPILTFEEFRLHKMYIQGNSVYITQYDNINESYKLDNYTHATHPGDYLGSICMKITKTSETGWIVDVYERYYYNIESSTIYAGDWRFAIFKFRIESEDEVIYKCRWDNVVTKLKTWKETYDINEMYNAYIAEYDIRNNKKLLAMKLETDVEGSEDYQLMTENEFISLTTQNYNEINSLLSPGYLAKDSFENIETINSQLFE